MKIISKFKDYYDSVAWTYGGGDPKIRYERGEINVEPFEYKEIDPPFCGYIYIKELRARYKTRTLIVGGRIYSVFQRYMPQYHEENRPFLPDGDHEIITSDKGWMRNWKEHGPRILYEESPHAIELCKRVGQPIFWIRQFYKEPCLAKWAFKQRHMIKIGKEPPMLCGITNFAKFYQANQIYQDLALCIGNLMHEPPDDNPPVQVEEKIRLEKKGFDSKTSFRGK